MEMTNDVAARLEEQVARHQEARSFPPMTELLGPRVPEPFADAEGNRHGWDTRKAKLSSRHRGQREVLERLVFVGGMIAAAALMTSAV